MLEETTFELYELSAQVSALDDNSATLSAPPQCMLLSHCNADNDNLVDNSLCVINLQATSYHRGKHAGGLSKS